MLARRVPVNAASLLVGRVITAVGTLLIVRTAAQRLDQQAFGLSVSVMAAGFLANLLVTFGTDTVVTRAVAAGRPDARAVAWSSLRLQLWAAAVITGVAALVLALGADTAILIQAAALVPMALVTVTGAILRGRQQMDRLLVASVAGAVSALIAVFVGFSQTVAAWVPIAALAVGSVVTAVVSTWFVGAGSLRGTRDSLMPLLRETGPFAAMVVLAAVGAQAGVLLVEFATDETAGGYGIAVRVTEAARVVPASVMGAFFPAMLAGVHRTDRYRTWMSWLLGYAVTAMVALLLLAEPINRIVFNEQPGGATLIRILSLGLVMTVIRLAMSFELIADGAETVVLRSAMVGAAVTVGGGLLVASRFGATGIGWAQLAGLAAAVGVLGWRRLRDS